MEEEEEAAVRIVGLRASWPAALLAVVAYGMDVLAHLIRERADEGEGEGRKA